jgi:hypothetical protein
MFKNLKNSLDKNTKNSNLLFYIIGGVIFLLAIIYLAMGIIGFLK